MKKITDLIGSKNIPGMKKLFRIMKLTSFFLLISVVSVLAGKTYSQTKLLSLNMGKTSVKEALLKIEDQSEFYFMYSEKIVDINREVSVNIENQKVETVLNSLFAGTNVNYTVKDRIIVLTTPDVFDNSVQVTFQQKSISGTVTDSRNQPLPGVTVVVKGTTQGAVTDVNGNYLLSSISENTTLVFSFVGMRTQEMIVGSQTSINITMEQEAIGIGEIVTIGYGTVKKSDLTGAIATLRSEDINTQVESKVIDALQGKVSGLSIESLGGEPGSNMRIQIRGAGSLSNNAPLVLIDGVPGDMSMLNPSNVKSMQVLKDASASAIYGARAANGVVLIETKTGVKGEVKILLDADYGVQQLTNKMDLLNATEWRMVNTDARAEAGLPPADFLTEYLGELPVEGTDWQDAMYVNAPVAKYNLSASGGTENLNYNIGVGYLDQDGIVITTNFKQLNLHIKTDFTKGKFRFGESILLSKEYKKNTPEDGGGRGDVVESAVMANPNIKIYNADYTQEQIDKAVTPVGSGGNVIGILNLDTDELDRYRIFASAYLEYEFIPGLKYKLNLGANSTLQHNLFARPIYSKQDVYAMGTQMRAQDGEMSESNSTGTYWLIENTLNYQKEFGNHSLNLLAGQSAEKSNWRDAGGTIYGLPNGVQVFSAGSRNASVFGSESANSISSFFGRAIYSYDSRYIFTVSLRRDGSSRFSPEYKYGTFPSYAVAWNASNEAFLQNSTTISMLRFRANYGVLGNESIGNYQYLGVIQPSYYYTTGAPARNWIGATQVNYPAVGIKWESTATGNIGMDLGLWNGKFDLTVDYFQKTTTDLLLRIPIPYSVGAGSDPYGNAGEVSNKGFETLLKYNGKIQDFNFSVTGTFSRIRNEVMKLSTVSQELSGANASLHGGSPVTYTKVGYPIYSFFVIETDGLFRNEAELAEHSKDGKLIQPNAQPGDIRFVDYNDDGIIDGKDRQYFGSGFPDYDYGFRFDANWKSFDLNFMLQGTHGNKIYNAFRTYTESVRAGNNYTTKVLDSYTYDPVNGNFPRLIITDPNGNGVDNSDQYLEDGSYLRIKTITLGYNFSKKLTNRVLIESARLYIGAQNLYTFTKYEGYNPDIGGGQYQGSSLGVRGIDYSVYPLPRSYHVGFQINF